MGFRFRLGPFTFGRSGTRLSLWFGRAGFSTPLSGRGRTYGKVGVGPVTWHGQSKGKDLSIPEEVGPTVDGGGLSSEEVAAVQAFRADELLVERLQKSGLPWRAVQEHLKERLPTYVSERDRVAYALVPKAMSLAFGKRGVAWRTEKRSSQNGSDTTTWIVIGH